MVAPSRNLSIRLPLHRSYFYFAPKYLHSPDLWQESMVAACKRVAELADVRNRFGAWCLSCKFGLIEVVLDAGSGLICIRKWHDETPDDDHIDEWEGFDLTVGQLDLALDQIVNDEGTGEWHPVPPYLLSDFKVATSFCRGLAAILRTQLNRAFATGAARIECKLRTPLNSWQTIEASELQYIRITPKLRDKLFDVDVELDEATDALGNNIMSLCIVPEVFAKSPSPKQKRPAKGKVGAPRRIPDREVREFVRESIRTKGSPRHDRRWNQSALAKEVLRRFPGRLAMTSAKKIISSVIGSMEKPK